MLDSHARERGPIFLFEERKLWTTRTPLILGRLSAFKYTTRRSMYAHVGLKWYFVLTTTTTTIIIIFLLN